MPRYRITETVVYHVDADDEQAALDVFTNSDDPDAYCVAITDRDVEPVDPQPALEGAA